MNVYDGDAAATQANRLMDECDRLRTALMRIRDLAAIEPRRYDDAGTRMAQIEALAAAGLEGRR